MSVRPLKPSTHIIFWFTTGALFFSTVFILKSVLLPFVLGIAVAYLLNPTVNRLGQFGIARGTASIIILLTFLIIISILLSFLIPILIRQILELSHNLPQYMQSAWEELKPAADKIQSYLGANTENGSLENVFKANSAIAVQAAQYLASYIAAGGQLIIDIITVVLFMPIVAYFMMKEWPDMTAWVVSILPRHSEETILDIIKEIDKKLSGFVRGQVSVSTVLAFGYAIALTIAGLKYGFLIGLGSGVLSVIPMVGSGVGLIVGLSVAWFQTANLSFVMLIAIIFIAGQIIEGNLLTPKLVGDSVGLHPLWIFFAILAGGNLLGLLGMFLAVPVTAVLGVLISFALKQYRNSRYYNDPIVDKAGSEPLELYKSKSTQTEMKDSNPRSKLSRSSVKDADDTTKQ